MTLFTQYTYYSKHKYLIPTLHNILVLIMDITDETNTITIAHIANDAKVENKEPQLMQGWVTVFEDRDLLLFKRAGEMQYYLYKAETDIVFKRGYALQSVIDSLTTLLSDLYGTWKMLTENYPVKLVPESYALLHTKYDAIWRTLFTVYAALPANARLVVNRYKPGDGV